MLGEFMYHNPTTLYFGSQSLENLDRELPLYFNGSFQQSFDHHAAFGRSVRTVVDGAEYHLITAT